MNFNFYVTFYWNVVSLRMEEELAANAMKWGVSALDPEIFFVPAKEYADNSDDAELQVIVLYV